MNLTGFSKLSEEGTFSVPSLIMGGFIYTYTQAFANSVIILVKSEMSSCTLAFSNADIYSFLRSKGTTEPVTIEFTLEDVFGVEKTLSVVVKASK